MDEVLNFWFLIRWTHLWVILPALFLNVLSPQPQLTSRTPHRHSKFHRMKIYIPLMPSWQWSPPSPNTHVPKAKRRTCSGSATNHPAKTMTPGPTAMALCPLLDLTGKETTAYGPRFELLNSLEGTLAGREGIHKGRDARKVKMAIMMQVKRGGALIAWMWPPSWGVVFLFYRRSPLKAGYKIDILFSRLGSENP